MTESLAFKDKAAAAMKKWLGTWTALFSVVAVIVFWLLEVHDPGELHLNLGLSFLASVQGVILQIAANRGDAKMEQVIYQMGEAIDRIDVNDGEVDSQLAKILKILDNMSKQENKNG